MAQRVIQFPVRNAFTGQRSHDAQERDSVESATQEQAHRIASQVAGEIARLAERQATGDRAAFEAVRSRDVLVMRPTTRATHLRRRLAAMPAAVLAFTSKLFSRD